MLALNHTKFMCNTYSEEYQCAAASHRIAMTTRKTWAEDKLSICNQCGQADANLPLHPRNLASPKAPADQFLPHTHTMCGSWQAVANAIEHCAPHVTINANGSLAIASSTDYQAGDLCASGHGTAAR